MSEKLHGRNLTYVTTGNATVSTFSDIALLHDLIVLNEHVFCNRKMLTKNTNPYSIDLTGAGSPLLFEVPHFELAIPERSTDPISI